MPRRVPLLLARAYNAKARIKGQRTAILALVPVVLLVFAGFALDGGLALAQRKAMQNAADAPAIAGAHEVALRHDQPSIYSTTPTTRRTSTPISTPTPCIADAVVISNLAAYLRVGGGAQPLNVRVHVQTNCGKPLTAALVTGQVRASGIPVGTPVPLPSLGGGDYGSCPVGLYVFQNNMTIDIKAVYLPLPPANATGNILGGSICP